MKRSKDIWLEHLVTSWEALPADEREREWSEYLANRASWCKVTCGICGDGFQAENGCHCHKQSTIYLEKMRSMAPQSTRELLEGHLGAPHDPVTSPAHYRQGTIEVIEAIEGLALGYHEGNVLKYLARYKYKNGVEDLRKAAWYLRRLIEEADRAA